MIKNELEQFKEKWRERGYSFSNTVAELTTEEVAKLNGLDGLFDQGQRVKLRHGFVQGPDGKWYWISEDTTHWFRRKRVFF